MQSVIFETAFEIVVVVFILLGLGFGEISWN